MTVHYSSDRALNDFARQCVADGWLIELTAGNHLRWTWPQTGEFFFSSYTPSDQRTLHHVKAHVARIVRDEPRDKRVGERRERKRKAKLPVRFDMSTAPGLSAYTKGQPGPATLRLGDVMPEELVAMVKT